MATADAMAALPKGLDPNLRAINPELRPVAEQILKPGLFPMPSAANIAEARKAQAASFRPLLNPGDRKVEIPVGGGQPEVAIYVVNARAGGSRPAILHTHGGGYVVGSAASSLPGLQKICLALDCVGVSVEYRLAPETTYVGSMEDNYAALKWLHANARELGADPSRIALFGESAGGGHAALLAITARDRGEVPVRFQCLVYPMLDDRTGASGEAVPYAETLIWTAEANRFGWESFLGVPPGGNNVPARAVPARVTDLRGLPPTFIGVGSIDLFYQEDVRYAQRLKKAGVKVDLVTVPGAFHGFDVFAPQTRVAQKFDAAVLNALRQGLA
jgi:acetyl esterase/lipase